MGNFLREGKFLLLGLCLIAGCPAPVEKLVVMRTADVCLPLPPPLPKVVDYYAGQSDGGCRYVACLDGPAADALGDNLSASRRWEAEAWLRCGAFDAGTRDAGQ